MFLAYLYMYAIVNDKEEFDERYDQPLFSMAAKYAGIDTSKCWYRYKQMHVVNIKFK